VLGDGSTRTTTGSETIKVYTSAGTKKVKVTVTATDGYARTAAADVVIRPVGPITVHQSTQLAIDVAAP
jgi:PKD repeat protein